MDVRKDGLRSGYFDHEDLKWERFSFLNVLSSLLARLH